MELKTFEEWKAIVGSTDDWESMEDWLFGSNEGREDYTHTTAWFIVCKELVDLLAEKFKGKKVVELGCGSGYLLKHLRDRGVDIVGYDIYENYGYTTIYVDDIIQEDYTKADLSNFDIILMTWPPMTNSANLVVRERMHKGQQLYVEGETSGGCTANDMFFDALDEMDWDVETTRALNAIQLQWSGLHDRWIVATK